MIGIGGLGIMVCGGGCGNWWWLVVLGNGNGNGWLVVVNIIGGGNWWWWLISLVVVSWLVGWLVVIIFDFSKFAMYKELLVWWYFRGEAFPFKWHLILTSCGDV